MARAHLAGLPAFKSQVSDLLILLEDAIDNIDYPGESTEKWIAKAKAHAAVLAEWARASVPDDSDWEYGWISRYPSGEQAGESDSGNTREFAERAVEMNRSYWPGQQNAPLEYTLSKRTRAVPAGPWVEVAP